MNATDEQLHILDLAKTPGNLMVKALAGTGKTSTLRMIEESSPVKPILFLAFNKKNAEEGRKVMASTTKCTTFNSLGHGILTQVIGRGFKPDPRKNGNIIREMISSAKASQKGPMWEAYWFVAEAMAKAKSMGYIPDRHAMSTRRLCDWAGLCAALDEEPDDLQTRMLNDALTISIKQAYQGTCDFDDQIYMPTLFGGTFPKFPRVMVDEYQDLNPINHAMIRKLVSNQLIGVGDPYQSIYEFRGANSRGMAEAVADFSMRECDLTISFRCPSEVVRSVHWHVPKFRWAKTGGNVIDLPGLDMGEIPGNSTFICRNNAPLFSLAMRCLSAGLGVNVSGSNIGPRLLRQMKKLGPETMTRAALLVAIAEWLAAKVDRGSKSAADQAACMKVFAEHGDNLGQALKYAEHLFKQEGQIYFTTGHKAKGLEYPVVFHLDPWLLGNTEQEKNLSYVISTRSSDQLYTVNSNDIKVF